MTQEQAVRLDRLLREASGLLDGAVGVAQKSLPESSFSEFRYQIGAILAEIYEVALEDLWEQFPDLKPEIMK